MSDTFKSCPFCGGAPCLRANHNNKTRCFFVMAECTFCGAQGRKYSSKEDPETVDWNNDACIKAVNTWNMRVSE